MTPAPPLAPELQEWVWLNGAFLPAVEARVSVLDEGLLLGTGVFTTLRIEASTPVWAEAHLARLTTHGTALGLPVPPWMADLPDSTATLAKRVGASRAVARWTWTAGVAGAPTLLSHLRPLPADLEAQTKGIHGMTLRVERPHASIKTTSWLAMSLACRRATAAASSPDAPTEALLVDRRGCVLEGARTNLFAVFGDTVVTPPARGRILAGIARARVLAALRTAQVAVREAHVYRRDLLRADSAWLTNCVVGLARLASVDGSAIQRKPWPVAEMVSKAPSDSGW